MSKKFNTDEAWIKELAKSIMDLYEAQWLGNYKNNDNFLSTIFLAWAPWAGKTEFVEWTFDEMNM